MVRLIMGEKGTGKTKKLIEYRQRSDQHGSCYHG